AAATAEPQADAPQAEGAPQAASAVIPAVAAPATTLTSIPAQGKASSKAKEETPQLTPAAGTLSVKVGPTEEEIAAAAAERAAEQEAAERAAAEEAENSADEQDQAEDTTETRDEDDSANRSNERSSRDDSSNSSSSDNSLSEEKKEEKSSPAPSAGKGSSILATARSGIGTPYVYGGTSTSGWDCSGFVQWVYAQHGINLPRGAADQAAAGTVIPRSEAQPGDLVYKPGHIGIYVGGNTFVDAGNSRVDTSERNIYSGSWTFIRVGS
ncbi:NlpC/P60 family protein, partial [Brachybacterium sp. JB7]|uniref:C40 family peptidase n=1 Tax=Brachybacterium sp. JB7 TaxID=2024478 RepID=UPI000E1B233A